MSKEIITIVIVMIIIFLISILFDQIPKWLKERKMSINESDNWTLFLAFALLYKLLETSVIITAILGVGV